MTASTGRATRALPALHCPSASFISLYSASVTVDASPTTADTAPKLASSKMVPALLVRESVKSWMFSVSSLAKATLACTTRPEGPSTQTTWMRSVPGRRKASLSCFLNCEERRSVQSSTVRVSMVKVATMRTISLSSAFTGTGHGAKEQFLSGLRNWKEPSEQTPMSRVQIGLSVMSSIKPLQLFSGHASGEMGLVSSPSAMLRMKWVSWLESDASGVTKEMRSSRTRSGRATAVWNQSRPPVVAPIALSRRQTLFPLRKGKSASSSPSSW
mmetsp:Transcript_5461/g.15215  ORF Transcript_5461/g.15215 Transcript_5461/m.15215 type:complete len:271 (-) Transcript_5461:521-1333(-)